LGQRPEQDRGNIIQVFTFFLKGAKDNLLRVFLFQGAADHHGCAFLFWRSESYPLRLFFFLGKAGKFCLPNFYRQLKNNPTRPELGWYYCTFPIE